jgi:hypothetical protein
MTRIDSGTARSITVAGLMAGALGMALAKLSGMDMPPVPPGAVLLVIAAGLVACVRERRWPVVVAVLVALAEAVPSAVSLGNVDGAGQTIGTLVRLAGALTALVAALVLGTVARRRSETHSPVDA